MLKPGVFFVVWCFKIYTILNLDDSDGNMTLRHSHTFFITTSLVSGQRNCDEYFCVGYLARLLFDMLWSADRSYRFVTYVRFRFREFPTSVPLIIAVVGAVYAVSGISNWNSWILTFGIAGPRPEVGYRRLYQPVNLLKYDLYSEAEIGRYDKCDYAVPLEEFK